MYPRVALTIVIRFVHVPDSVFWYNKAEDELEEALDLDLNRRTAKNVIVFIGDGMGVATVTAAR